MSDDVYKKIDIAANNIRAVLQSNDFSIEEKKDLIMIATRKILDNLKLI